jgi:hypothetical protein
VCRAVGEHLSTWAVVVASAVIFWLGHASLIPERLTPTSWLPRLAILALGFAFTLLRVWFKSRHLNLALHLSFYLVFA